MNKQEYLLTCLSEEASEIILAVGKAQRFGLDDTYNKKSLQVGTFGLEEVKFDSPREAIIREFNDLIAVLELLNENGVDFKNLHQRDMIEAKKKKVKNFMEYSIEKGLLK